MSDQASAPDAHWARWFAVVAAVTLAAVGIVAVRAAPLIRGSSGWGPGRPRGDARTRAIWGARPFAIGFELINDGAVPVRITSVSIPALADQDLLTWGAATFDPQDRGSNDPGTLVPFEGWTLHHGEAIWVVVRGTFGNCEAFPAPPSGGSVAQTWSEADVAFRSGDLVPRHQSVPLPTTVDVQRPVDCLAA